MPKLPRVSGAEAIRAPATGTLRGILKQAGVSVEEFTQQL
jgi:predicted RNA binding protein YcfA (HicA-like mRNA interferase family)